MTKATFKYQTDENPGQVVQIVTEADITEFRPDGRNRNNEVGDDITIPITAYATANRSHNGIHCRCVWVGLMNQETLASEIQIYLLIPVLRQFVYRGYHVGDVGLFRDMEFIILGKRPEVMRN